MQITDYETLSKLQTIVFFVLIMQIKTILLTSIISIEKCEVLYINQLAIPLILESMYILFSLHWC